MKNKKKMNKNAMTQLKAYFLIINMIVAIVAFGWLVTGSPTDRTNMNGYTPIRSDATLRAASEIKTSTVIAPNGMDIIGENGEILDHIPKGNIINLGTEKITTQVGERTIELSRTQYDGALNNKIVSSPITGGTATQGKGLWGGIGDFFGKNLVNNLIAIIGIGLIVGIVANLIFPGGNAQEAGMIAGAVGTLVQRIAKSAVGPGEKVNILGLKMTPTVFGIVTGIVIFLFMYEKTSTEIVEFNCLPWEAPVGGADCELCNEIENGCSEYRCKSLGQACGIPEENKGIDDKCVWINPHDVNSPIIQIGDLLQGYIWKPDRAVRPPATGVVISKEDGSCVEAFTALEFQIITDEISQCKIDYNLTRNYTDMNYYVGGSNVLSYNHTETMSLPGPDAINRIAPELKNDGTYTLYVRCRDANGNFNQDAFSIRFCVNPGPDTTPPQIVDVSIPSKSPILFNTTSLDIEVYVNEPSECKWSREDRNWDSMETSMECSTNLWEMNNNNVYTCKTTLTGIKDRAENNFYFRCKDQPGAEEGDRNVNTQSYKYTITGTQPLNILSVGPNETIRGSTDTIPVYLTVKTDNGYNNGEAICYYSTTGIEADYIQFRYNDTDWTNEHSQRQDLTTGNYKYYFKCVDLGGNTAYNSTSFKVEVDRSSPKVVRVYREGDLKIITDEKSICSYSNKDCNFEIKDGIAMPYDNEEVHTAEWKSQNYYIRCKDEYDNQPNPNTCSIVVKPYNLRENVIEL